MRGAPGEPAAAAPRTDAAHRTVVAFCHQSWRETKTHLENMVENANAEMARWKKKTAGVSQGFTQSVNGILGFFYNQSGWEWKYFYIWNVVYEAAHCASRVQLKSCQQQHKSIAVIPQPPALIIILIIITVIITIARIIQLLYSNFQNKVTQGRCKGSSLQNQKKW